MTFTLKPLDLGKKRITTAEALEELRNYMPDDTPASPPIDMAGDIPPAARASVTDAGDVLKLEHIICYDANGTPFEEYPELYIMNDVVRDADGNHKKFTSYSSIAYNEERGLFVPSMALSSNIIAALFSIAVEKTARGYHIRDNDIAREAATVLAQYKDYWHAQNTLVDWKNSNVIHYPHDSDFPSHGGDKSINQSQNRVSLSFNRTGLADETIADAMKKDHSRRFLQQATGLRDLQVLVSIGEYFGKEARMWKSDSKEIRSAWLGGNSLNFEIDANGNLSGAYAVRGIAHSRGLLNCMLKFAIMKTCYWHFSEQEQGRRKLGMFKILNLT